MKVRRLWERVLEQVSGPRKSFRTTVNIGGSLLKLMLILSLFQKPLPETATLLVRYSWFRFIRSYGSLLLDGRFSHPLCSVNLDDETTLLIVLMKMCLFIYYNKTTLGL